jgi:hypothetical protein
MVITSLKSIFCYPNYANYYSHKKIIVLLNFNDNCKKKLKADMWNREKTSTAIKIDSDVEQKIEKIIEGSQTNVLVLIIRILVNELTFKQSNVSNQVNMEEYNKK